MSYLDEADANECEYNIVTTSIDEKTDKLKESALPPYEDKQKQCEDSRRKSYHFVLVVSVINFLDVAKQDEACQTANSSGRE